MKRHWTHAALAALVMFLYRRVLFSGDAFILRDALEFTLPAREYLGASIAQGRIPEWWDGVGLGLPFAATPTYGVVQPLAWLFTSLGAPGADLYALFHLLLAGIGAALLAAEWGAGRLGAFVAGGTLVTSGYAASTLFNNLSPVFAWTPFVAWATVRFVGSAAGGARARRRAWAVLAACLALQLWPAEPGGVVTAGLLAGALVLAHSERRLRDLAGLALASGSALVLAAAPLLPAWELLRSSERAGGLDLAKGGAWSLHPWRLVELIWPEALGRAVGASWLGDVLANTGGPGLGPSWSLSVFVGAPALLLAALAAAGSRRERRALAVSVAFVVLALGVETPVYGAFRAVFLPERLVRYPEKHLIGAIVLWAALAGVGVGRMSGRAPPRWVVAVAATLGTIQLVLAATLAWRPGVVAALLAERLAGTAAAAGLDGTLRVISSGGLVAALATLAFAAALALAGTGWRARILAPVAAAGLVLAPLAWHERAFTVLAPRALVSGTPAILSQVADARVPGARPRLLRGMSLAQRATGSPENLARYWHETASGNTAARFGFAVLPGLQAESTAAEVRFWTLAAGQRRGIAEVASLAGAAWILGADEEVRGLPLPEVARHLAFGWSLYANPSARPRAFVTGSWVRVADEDAAVVALAAPGRARRPSLVVLSGEGPAPGPGATEEATPTACEVDAARPERVELACRAPRAGYAVLLDAFAPGWTATVDGAPARVERADGVFRAVAVGPGLHRVAFRYRTPGLRLGVAISLLAWLGWLAAVLARGEGRGIPGAAPRAGDEATAPEADAGGGRPEGAAG
jgi:hypothetical protein